MLRQGERQVLRDVRTRHHRAAPLPREKYLPFAFRAVEQILPLAHFVDQSIVESRHDLERVRRTSGRWRADNARSGNSLGEIGSCAQPDRPLGPIYEHVPDQRPGANLGYLEIVSEDDTARQPTLMEPGDVLFFRSNLMHMSTNNVADERRTAMGLPLCPCEYAIQDQGGGKKFGSGQPLTSGSQSRIAAGLEF